MCRAVVCMEARFTQIQSQIVSVRMPVCMCVCSCMCMYPPPRQLITSGVMWLDMDSV